MYDDLSEKEYTNDLYQPYTGGGGPTSEQVANNNKALMKILDEEAIAYEYKSITSVFEHYADPFQAIFISPILAVSYDRWGYCFDGAIQGIKEDFPDQASLDTTIKFILQHKNHLGNE